MTQKAACFEQATNQLKAFYLQWTKLCYLAFVIHHIQECLKYQIRQTTMLNRANSKSQHKSLVAAPSVLDDGHALSSVSQYSPMENTLLLDSDRDWLADHRMRADHWECPPPASVWTGYTVKHVVIKQKCFYTGFEAWRRHSESVSSTSQRVHPFSTFTSDLTPALLSPHLGLQESGPGITDYKEKNLEPGLEKPLHDILARAERFAAHPIEGCPEGQ